MGSGLVLFSVALLFNVGAFLGLRAVAARAFGARGARVVFAIDSLPWSSVSFGKRLVFALAGPLGCYLAAGATLALGVALGGLSEVDEQSLRVVVAPFGAAATAGLANEDRIVSVEGVPIADWTALKREISKHPGHEIDVVVERNGSEMHLHPVPGQNGKIAVGPRVLHRAAGAGVILERLFVEPALVNVRTVASYSRLLGGHERAEIAGPVEIVQTAGKQSVANGIQVAGTVNAFYLWAPLLLAGVLFPRERKRPRP